MRSKEKYQCQLQCRVLYATTRKETFAVKFVIRSFNTLALG